MPEQKKKNGIYYWVGAVAIGVSVAVAVFLIQDHKAWASIQHAYMEKQSRAQYDNLGDKFESLAKDIDEIKSDVKMLIKNGGKK